MNVSKPINVGQLMQEILAAGVDIPGLSLSKDGTQLVVWQNGVEDGPMPAAAIPVINAHVANNTPVWPDLRGLITALTNSTSIDLPTKQALIDALNK